MCVCAYVGLFVSPPPPPPSILQSTRGPTVTLPVYLNGDRRHCVCNITLPSQADVDTAMWQFRCVAVVAWHQ